MLSTKVGSFALNTTKLVPETTKLVPEITKLLFVFDQCLINMKEFYLSLSNNGEYN